MRITRSLLFAAPVLFIIGCAGGATTANAPAVLPRTDAQRSLIATASVAQSPTTIATIRCITQANSGSSAPAPTFALKLACAPAPGDALIASVYTTGSLAPASATSVTSDIPAGFSRLGPGPTYSGSLGQANLSYVFATGAESTIAITDPGANPFLWAVTIYDVETPGPIVTTAVATSTLSPLTASITPLATGSLAIGIFGTQDSDIGLPSQPGFWPLPGWTKTTGYTPQYTRLKTSYNILQGSTYRTLTSTAPMTLSAVFTNGGNLATNAGVAQMILVAPGSAATPTPAPTPIPTPTPAVNLGSSVTTPPTVKCVTEANSGTAIRSSTFTFNLGCAPNPGDLLVASVYTTGVVFPDGSSGLTADMPAGFSQVGSGPTYSGSLGEANVSSKIATGSEATLTVTDPAFNALAWAVTVYDVENPGQLSTASVATFGSSPVTPSIAPSATNALGIAVWGVQNSAAGPPSQPGLWPSGGWTKAPGLSPQYTRIAATTNNVLQGSAYRTLTSTAPFTVNGPFYNGGNLTAGPGVAQIIVVAPGTGSTIVRRGFLGAFYRAIGPPPYGVFSASASPITPNPYPTPQTVLFGSTGYCDQVAANGVSISSGQPVDATKLADLVNLGAKWARMTVAASYVDQSHIWSAGSFTFLSLDAAQCALMRHGVTPVVDLENGPVQYNATPGTYSPVIAPTYATPADFGSYCGAVAKHESQILGPVTRYSIPGNEVNSNTTLFPGGVAQIASYTEACYAAIKANQPNAFVYGFELNMLYNINAPGFVRQLASLGCKPGTCYDGISMHLYMPYPIPALATPCFPNVGGNYDEQCVTDVRTASGKSTLHILIGETAFMVPATVPDEATKARAVVAALNLFALDPNIDGVNYANVDECGLYPTGGFSGGCLIDITGAQLPAYGALSALAAAAY